MPNMKVKGQTVQTGECLQETDTHIHTHTHTHTLTLLLISLGTQSIINVWQCSYKL